jgi:archaellum component FlaC
MSMAQDFLDRLRTGRVETKVVSESIHPWTRLRAVLENGNESQPSAYEKAVENPVPALGNATPKFAPAVSIHKAMQQQAAQQNPPQPAESGGDANASEQTENYEERIDRIFDRKHFGRMVAPAIRNSIRKALKEQLPGLDYKNPDFIKQFEEINEQVTKAASKTAGELEIILDEYKASVKKLAGVKESNPSVLAEES